MAHRIDGLTPTHVCRTCGARWRYAIGGASEPEGWRLMDFVSAACCNITTPADAVEPITGEQMRNWIRQKDKAMARQALEEALDNYIEYYEHAEYGEPSDDVREWIADAIMGLSDDENVEEALSTWATEKARCDGEWRVSND